MSPGYHFKILIVCQKISLSTVKKNSNGSIYSGKNLEFQIGTPDNLMTLSLCLSLFFPLSLATQLSYQHIQSKSLVKTSPTKYLLTFLSLLAFCPAQFVLFFFQAIDLNALANFNKLFSFFEDCYKLFLLKASILETYSIVFGCCFYFDRTPYFCFSFLCFCASIAIYSSQTKFSLQRPV